MANTYQLITSTVLGGTSTLVTFSSIPNSYTDLVILGSVRSAQNTPINVMRAYFNGDTSALYSMTDLEGAGTAQYGQRTSNATDIFAGGFVAANTATTSAFSSFDFYIPSYLVARSKQLSIFGVGENISSTWAMDITAGLYRSNTAINSVSITNNGQSFVAGSSFYLYGIKNS